MENMERIQGNDVGFIENPAGQGALTLPEQQGYAGTFYSQSSYLPEEQRYMQAGVQTTETAPFNSAVDNVAINQYFDIHNLVCLGAGHSPRRECGAVIRTNLTRSPIGLGTTNDVIGPLLDGLNLSRAHHEGNIRGIVSYSGNIVNYSAFWHAMNNYADGHLVTALIGGRPTSVRSPVGAFSFSLIAGLLHCHPGNTGFSIHDKYFARFLNIPVYLVTGPSHNVFRVFRPWMNESSNGEQLRP